MHKNTEYYYKSSLDLLLPVTEISTIEGFGLKLGKNRYYFHDKITPINNTISHMIAGNKFCTSSLLAASGLPVPRFTSIDEDEFNAGLLETKIADLTFPLVAKPTVDSSFGQDVLCNIQNRAQLKKYLHEQCPLYNLITIEEFHGNLKSYRVLVFYNKVIGVVLREPGHVVGDGVHTLQELMDISNERRALESDILGPILADDECLISLTELGINLHYIPKINEYVRLYYTCNSSRGGTFIALGKKICRKNRQLMIKAAQVLNLGLVGFDVMCEDINKPIEGTRGVIIEANDKPSIRVHEESTQGKPTRVTLTIMRSFILRHPFSYMASLFRHSRIGIYLRAIIILILLAIAFSLIF